MDPFLELIKSDLGVAIAWICTVGSTVFAMIKVRENRILKVRINSMTNISTNDRSQDSITQNGQKNIYTKYNSGDMNIKM